MKSFTTLLATAAVATTTVSAQWGGQVFFNSVGDCPAGTQADLSEVWSNNMDSLCFASPLGGSWAGKMNGALQGTGGDPPTSFGACPTDDCSEGCTTVTIDNDNGVLSACLNTEDSQPFVWIGY